MKNRNSGEMECWKTGRNQWTSNIERPTSNAQYGQVKPLEGRWAGRTRAPEYCRSERQSGHKKHSFRRVSKSDSWVSKTIDRLGNCLDI